MSNYSPAFQQALALYEQQPWPDDIESQLEVLLRQAPPEEGELFGDLFEGLMAGGRLQAQ